MDVKTTFLHSDLEEELYMEQSKGFVTKRKDDCVCRLKKSLYGLKQAPREWYKNFESVMVEQGYKMTTSDHWLTCDRKAKNLWLSQDKFIEKVLQRFNIEKAKAMNILFATHLRLIVKHNPSTEKEKEKMQKVNYSSVVGSLMYVMCVALSTTKSEFIVATKVCKEMLWMKKFVHELGFTQEMYFMYCDNQSAIHLGKNSTFHARFKHIDVSYHWIQDVLEAMLLELEKIHTDDNGAHMLTKPYQEGKIAVELQREKAKNAEHMERISSLEAHIQHRDKESLVTNEQESFDKWYKSTFSMNFLVNEIWYCSSYLEKSFKRHKMEAIGRRTGDGNGIDSEMASKAGNRTPNMSHMDESHEDRLINWMSMDETKFSGFDKLKDDDITGDHEEMDDSDDEDEYTKRMIPTFIIKIGKEHVLYENPGIQRKIFYPNRQNPTLCPIQILEEEKAMRPSDPSGPLCLFFMHQWELLLQGLGHTLLFMERFPNDHVQREAKYKNLDLLQKYYRIGKDTEGEELFLSHFNTAPTDTSRVANTTTKSLGNNILYHNQTPYHLFPPQPENSFMPTVFWPFEDSVLASKSGTKFVKPLVEFSSRNTFLLQKQQVLLTVLSHHLQRMLTGSMKLPPEMIINGDGDIVLNYEYEEYFPQDSDLASWLLSNAISEKGDDIILTYLTCIKEIWDTLASYGSVVTPAEYVMSFLKGMPCEYQPNVAVISPMRESLTLDAIYTMLVDAETQLAGFDAQADVLPMGANHAQGKGLNLPNRGYDRTSEDKTSRSYAGRASGRSGGRGRGRLRVQCQMYGKIGHLVYCCWHRYDEDYHCVSNNRSESANVQYSVVDSENMNCDCCYCNTKSQTRGQSTVRPQAHITTTLQDRWIVDISATHHVTPDAANILQYNRRQLLEDDPVNRIRMEG
ncbi:hypothetical protein F3Y22_tig00001478pilonHSYRG00298 [Hibiscus syriacus]|uniref:Reverse transcriptase Ty1/copia-type domain-containing protein n=1 Tax=Hibiscus syriacus TaxID=106335 RepID=A0A6A3CXE7_HIBSY|nr:hypothetical protein F3Y22_tig00001478pilonHSYRG00298 [Hibiscus syriacus]